MTDQLAIEYVPSGNVQPHPDNARQGDVGAIHTSITASGVYRPIIVQQSTGNILAGNHTYLAMLDAGIDEVPVVYRDVDDTAARKIMLADNRTADLGDYDQQKLVELLQAVPDLDGTGYDGDDLDALIADLPDMPMGHADTVGERIKLLDVTFGDPEHEVELGETWHVGRHILVIAELADEHDLWAPHLTGRIFAPYPEPYITMSYVALNSPMLLVQPNIFLAGHLLDAHSQGHPDDTIERQ